MSIFIGKFSSAFDNGGFDQIKEKCCIGGEEGSTWYNGLNIGDYVFPIREGEISTLWKLKGYEKKVINGEENSVAVFDEVKSFNPTINLNTFIKYKDFNLDINLLNKIKKQTQGYGFHKVDYVKPDQEIEQIDFEGNERRIYIALENKELDLKNSDVVVKIKDSDEKNIIGYYIFNNDKETEYQPLIDLYKEKNITKYSLNELLEFSNDGNYKAPKKNKFLNLVINELNTKGYFEVNNPVDLYDNIVVGRKVSISIKSKPKTQLKKTLSNSVMNESNLIYRKKMDYSAFNKRITIPNIHHKLFLDNLSEEVTRGHSVKVKLLVNDKLYKGTLAWPNSIDRKGVTIQLLYNEKPLLELLKDKLSISYDYITKYMDDNKGKKPAASKIPDEYEEYVDFYIGEEKDIFIMNFISKHETDDDENVDDEVSDEIIDNSEMETDISTGDSINHIYDYILSKGFNYKEELIKNLYVSLKTKPFVILSGISGTGKSKIIELFAEAIGANNINGRFKLLPVKPDWSDATDLLGYRNIEGKFNPGSITSFAYEAMKHPNLPYFLCLDEMNLARVEYYFSDVLSLMETRKFNEDGDIITNMLLSKEQIGRDEASINKYGDVYLPQNLYIVGTVNMYETTFPFSKKVLDRANTIEFNEVELAFDFDNDVKADVISKTYDNNLLKTEYLKLASCSEHKDIATKVINKLIAINKILTPYNQHFGYRVRDEIVFYMIYATRENIMSFDVAWDFCISQKILPKISGSSNEVLEILLELYKHFNNITDKYNEFITDAELKAMEDKAKKNEYIITNKKLILMIRRYLRDGFTTYWQ